MTLGRIRAFWGLLVLFAVFRGLLSTTSGQEIRIFSLDEATRQLEASAPAGQAFQLLMSHNLQDWLPWRDPAAGTLRYALTLERDGARFFRLRVFPQDNESFWFALLGDSSVADFAANFDMFYGWGHGIHDCFQEHVKTINFAQPGHSTSRFLSSDVPSFLLRLKPRFVLIHFGLVDKWWVPQVVGEGFSTSLPEYEENLRLIVADIRSFGGIPLLATPIPPRYFDEEGLIERPLEDRSEVVRKVAQETGSYLVELNQPSLALFNELGPNGSEYLAWPNDPTHFSREGANELAELAVRQLPEILKFHSVKRSP